jgi:hypothetical protein
MISKILLTLCVLLGLEVYAQDRFTSLKPGLSDIDVKKLLGEPAHIEPFATVKNNTSDTSVYWRYENNKIIVITNHLFDRVEKNRTELLKFIQRNASNTKEGGLTIVSYGKD